jgi:dephospho-CoA kinase
MKLLGLTGGIGMGKSTAAGCLARLGLKVIDTDQIARDVVAPGQPALQEIQDAFGADVLAADGSLRRDELARRVFADPAARKRLEAIVHPRIRETWLSEVEHWRGADVQAGVVVIPLLFETDVAGHFDHTICVACTAATQRARLRERGWDDAGFDRRLAAQLPIEQKMTLADFVVWNEAVPDVLEAQLRRLVEATT